MDEKSEYGMFYYVVIIRNLENRINLAQISFFFFLYIDSIVSYTHNLSGLLFQLDESADVNC